MDPQNMHSFAAVGFMGNLAFLVVWVVLALMHCPPDERIPPREEW